jgi:hypothetical protein
MYEVRVEYEYYLLVFPVTCTPLTYAHSKSHLFNPANTTSTLYNMPDSQAMINVLLDLGSQEVPNISLTAI